MSHNPLVFIDGIDGSGKSTLAQRLYNHLTEHGHSAVLLSVDDFRRPVQWNHPQFSEQQLYYDHYFDLALLDQALAQIANGAKELEIPVFKDGIEGGCIPSTRHIHVPNTAFILVEGVFTQRLDSASLGPLIYVDCAWDDARLRILRRDHARGRALADIEHRIQQRYFPAQRVYHDKFSPAQRAHWLMSSRGESGGFSLDRHRTPVAAPGLSVPQAMLLHAALAEL